MAEICALPDYEWAGETRGNRESLLQNTKGWARLFASSPAFFCLPGLPFKTSLRVTQGD
jgi:hypothetical protein